MDKITTMAEFWEEAERLDPDGFAKARAERAEMETLCKDAERYRVIRQDHEGKVLPDIAMYGDRALDEYIDDRWAKAQAVGAMPAAPDAPVVGVAMCPECGCASCNGECAGDDMMGD